MGGESGGEILGGGWMDGRNRCQRRWAIQRVEGPSLDKTQPGQSDKTRPNQGQRIKKRQDKARDQEQSERKWERATGKAE
jgi:hypothetical protein